MAKAHLKVVSEAAAETVIDVRRLSLIFQAADNPVFALADIDRRVQFVKGWLRDASLAPAVLGRIGSGTPSGVYLTELNYAEDDAVTLRGTAAAMSD